MQTCSEHRNPDWCERKAENSKTPFCTSLNALCNNLGFGLLASGYLCVSVSGSIQLPLLLDTFELLLGLVELLLLFLRHTGQERHILLVMKVVVVCADDSIGIVQRNLANIGNGLDLGRAFLVLRIRHLQAELLRSALDCVPTSEPASEVHVARHAEILRVDDFVRGGVVQNSLGVNSSLVGEGAETGDVVVEGDVDLDEIGNEVLNFLELLDVVLAEDIVAVRNDHASHQTTKRGDAVSLANTEYGGIDVRGSSLQCAVGIGNGAARIVVEVCLDVARNNTAESSHQVVDLAGRRATNCVSDTDTVDTNLVDGAVDGQQVNEIRPERVLGTESNLLALALDKLNDLKRRVLDVSHVLAVAVLAEVARGSDDDIETVNARLDSDPGIVHMASYVSEDLGFQLEIVSERAP
jgi:hypothetical protein